MELKLNIYDDDNNIVKTYTKDSYRLKWGVASDLINGLNLDGLKADDNVEFIKAATNVVTHSFGVVQPLIKRIFKGLTDEELENTYIDEIVTVLVTVVKYTMSQIGLGNNGKN